MKRKQFALLYRQFHGSGLCQVFKDPPVLRERVKPLARKITVHGLPVCRTSQLQKTSQGSHLHPDALPNASPAEYTCIWTRLWILAVQQHFLRNFLSFSCCHTVLHVKAELLHDTWKTKFLLPKESALAPQLCLLPRCIYL